MTLKSGIISNVFWRSVQIASSLLLNILMVRLLGPAGSGAFFYTITILSLYIQVGGFSLESAIGFFGSGDKLKLRSLANFALVWSLMISVICLAAYLVLTTLPEAQLITGAFNVFMFITGNLLISYFSALFSSKMDFRIPNIVGTVVNAALFVSIIGFSIYGKVDFTSWIGTAFYASFLVRGIWMALHFYILLNEPTQRSLMSTIQLKKLFQYSLLAWLANLATFMLYRVDYYFVQRFCSPEDLGVYIQVCRTAQMFFLFPSMIASVIFPVAASNQHTYLTQGLASLGRSIFYIVLVLCLLLSVSGYWLFPLMFGPGFEKMYITFPYLVPGIIGLATIYPYTAFYAGTNRVAVNIKGSILALVVVVAGDMLLIPAFGIRGAAAVSSAGFIVYQFYILWHFKKEQAVSFGQFFNFQVTDFRRIARSINQLTHRNETQQ